MFAKSFGFKASFICALVFFIFAFPGFASGQTERLELGRRLQRFELAWESADSRHRAECVSAVKSAVNSFFGLQLPAAGKHLDQAWQTVRGEQRISDLEKFSVGHQLVFKSVIADAGQTGIEMRLTPFYPSESLPPDKTRVALTLFDKNQKRVAEQKIPLADLLEGFVWETGVLTEGDYRLYAELKCEGDSFSCPETTISRIDKLNARIEALEQSLIGAVGKIDDTVRATVRDTVVLLKSMKKREVQETNHPALARLKMCEDLLGDGRKPGEVIGPIAKETDVWLSLAKGRASVPVRLRAPAETNAPMPVLFLLHGVGGSENMFFETYGAGRVVAEGLKRGWLVVAPRQGLFGLPLDISEMLDVLGQSFDIDRSKVMLMGHSMGAAQVVRQAALHPELPVAAVALGGGNRVSDATKLKPIVWFVGAGSDDFGKGGAMQLQKSLDSAGVSSTYHEYPNVEHMVIVQAAINDTFQFFDKALQLEKEKAGKD